MDENFSKEFKSSVTKNMEELNEKKMDSKRSFRKLYGDFGYIHIADEDEFHRKLSSFITGGIENLHIISDFDRTLTNPVVDGKRVPSALALIRMGNYLSENYSKKAEELFKKFHPIEIDKNISPELKNEMMEKWWNSQLSLAIEERMNKKVVKRVVEDNLNILRKKASHLFDISYYHNVPFLIFSAGVGDIIENFLKEKNKYYKSIYVHSNFYKYGFGGLVKGYKSNIIHTFNKKASTFQNKHYFSKIENKKNVILMGDSIGDVTMAEGIDFSNILKIGFLNEKINENLDEYKNKFDVVLVDTDSMDFAHRVVDEIIKNSNSKKSKSRKVVHDLNKNFMKLFRLDD